MNANKLVVSDYKDLNLPLVEAYCDAFHIYLTLADGTTMKMPIRISVVDRLNYLRQIYPEYYI